MSEIIQNHILHVDMDAFFAAVEERDDPNLRGRPVLIGGSPTGRGVVSTANYEARKFGCHSGMPMARAVKLCPQAIRIRGDMSKYAAASEEIFDIMQKFTPVIEPLSIDEAFLDVKGCERLFGSAESIAKKIKIEIKNQTKLTASVGVACNKFLAKLASDLDKPDGLTIVPPDAILEFIGPLKISRLWGAGKATLPKFEALHLRTFEDVRKLPLSELKRNFGSAGEMFYQFVRGIDNRQVEPISETKSISAENTFPVDIRDLESLRMILLDQTDHVARRLRRQNLLAKTVTIKLRSPEFTTISRSTTFTTPSDQTDQIWNALSTLFETWRAGKPFPIRLIGMGVSSLSPHSGQQLTLFDQAKNEKSKHLDQGVDQIRDKFGFGAITRGLSQTPKKPKK